jgi:hypothetical protein
MVFWYDPEPNTEETFSGEEEQKDAKDLLFLDFLSVQKIWHLVFVSTLDSLSGLKTSLHIFSVETKHLFFGYNSWNLLSKHIFNDATIRPD